MRYLIWIDEALWEAPVAHPEVEYLETEVLSRLTPMGLADYLAGPAGILHTAARSSYILHDSAVLWIVEWTGFLVFRFTPDGSISWALRSPIPDVAEGEDANPQFTLIFNAFDAQVDAEMREWRGFHPAPTSSQQAWDAAMASVQRGLNELFVRIGDDPSEVEAWQQGCARSPLWSLEPAD